VIARVGRGGGFIGEHTYALALTVTVLSMALSPLVYPGLLPAVRRWVRRRPAAQTPAISLPGSMLENHVVVAGYGRTGRAVADALQKSAVPYVVVEFSHEVVSQALEQGLPAIWGDISSEEILRAAAIGQARMLVMAVPQWYAIQLGIARARQFNPRLYIVARATRAAHVHDLRVLHVDGIVQPEFEGGIEMVRRALAQCDRSEDDIERVTHDLRAALYDPTTDEA
jgi:CPA2 family monovalent cation:H+ antiporter-2